MGAGLTENATYVTVYSMWIYSDVAKMTVAGFGVIFLLLQLTVPQCPQTKRRIHWMSMFGLSIYFFYIFGAHNPYFGWRAFLILGFGSNFVLSIIAVYLTYVVASALHATLHMAKLPLASRYAFLIIPTILFTAQLLALVGTLLTDWACISAARLLSIAILSLFVGGFLERCFLQLRRELRKNILLLESSVKFSQMSADTPKSSPKHCSPNISNISDSPANLIPKSTKKNNISEMKRSGETDTAVIVGYDDVCEGLLDAFSPLTNIDFIDAGGFESPNIPSPPASRPNDHGMSGGSSTFKRLRRARREDFRIIIRKLTVLVWILPPVGIAIVGSLVYISYGLILQHKAYSETVEDDRYVYKVIPDLGYWVIVLTYMYFIYYAYVPLPAWLLDLFTHVRTCPLRWIRRNRHDELSEPLATSASSIDHD